MLRILAALFFPIVLLGLLESFLAGKLIRVLGSDHILVLIYIGIALIGYLGVFLAIRYFRESPLNRSAVLNFLVGFGFAAIIQKLIFVMTLIVYGLGRLLYALLEVIRHSRDFFVVPSSPEGVAIALIVSLLSFFAMLYGILWGKYNFQVEHVDLAFRDLPKTFDGFKIVQISDAHSGTWDSLKGVEKGINLIRKQKPDLIVFTGDLVNVNKDEINPFIHLFKNLNAPFGKYAILGNHDYYGQPREKEYRQEYYDDFFSKFREMGFDLILNENREIQKDGKSIRLIGVENWGSGRYFPKRGDLDLATKNVKPNEFSILLSHDPSHWDLKVLQFPHHFHLTLSGHTHGMQFGINLPFFKWSPVKYRYKRWMGLYKQQDQYLYVNRGFGLLVYPGRVGMSPEVTVICLKGL